MIIGHDTQRELLGNIVRGAKMHHGFLFTGPESVGKKTIAQSFAKKLVYSDTGDAWDVFEGIDSDVHHVSPEMVEKKGKITIKDISIDQILQVKKALSLAADKDAKVLIIDDAHRMTISAQNALLKTLEEPFPNSYIVLVTHNPDRLLDTIRSRCFGVQFNTVSDDVLRKMFDSDEYVGDAQGKPGYLYHLHSDPLFRETVEYARTQLQGLFQKKLHERMSLAAELAKKDDQYIALFFAVWIYRIWGAAHKTKKYNLLKAAEKIEMLLQKLQKTNVNKQLVLEDLLIHIV